MSNSQERLSKERVTEIKRNICSGKIYSSEFNEIFAELKRLQAIEAALTNGIPQVKDIYDYWEDHDGPAIYSGQTVASIIYDVVTHLNIKIKGVNDHE